MTFENGIQQADEGEFGVMVDKKGDDWRRRVEGEYGDITYGAVCDALEDLIPDLEDVATLQVGLDLYNHLPVYNDTDPELRAKSRSCGPWGEIDGMHELYPGKDEVSDRAPAFDPKDRGYDTYEEAFRRIQADHGLVKAARIGNTWVYYPANYPDPPEANYVLQYGENYDPDQARGIDPSTGEPMSKDPADSPDSSDPEDWAEVDQIEHQSEDHRDQVKIH